MQPPIAAVLPVHKGRVTFGADDGSYAELKRRVREEMDATGGRAVRGPRMYLKTAIVLVWLGASCGLLTFGHATWWQAACWPSRWRWPSRERDSQSSTTRTTALTPVTPSLIAALDLLGASSYLWHWKHNILHHTFTNIEGADHDLDAKPFGRPRPRPSPLRCAPSSGESRIADGWAKHQVRTTVDFARSNRLLTWYLGGLNFQVEHHLFPKLCHINYPRISRVVEEVCAQYGVPYVAHERMRDALVSHWRWLRRLGLAPGAASVMTAE